MDEWFEPMWKRRQALEQARTLQDAGIDRIDFLYGWYNDETRVIVAKAFDGGGRALRDTPEVTRWAEAHMPEAVPGWPSYSLCSYSPRHHQVVQIGELDYNDSYEGQENGESKRPLSVAHPEAVDLVAMLTWHPDVPEDVVYRGAGDSRIEVRAAVASNPSTPTDLLARLACDPDHRVRRSVALNPAGPADILIPLAGDSDREVRDALASNYNAPAAALVALASAWNDRSGRDRDDGVLAAKAMLHPGFPYAWLLERLTDGTPLGRSVDLRVALASHAESTTDVLATLSRQPEPEVRRAVARNESVPLAVLAALYADSDTYVRLDASDALRLLDFGNEARIFEARAFLASDAATPSFRIGLQRHRNVPGELVSLIARDLPDLAEWASRRLAEVDPARQPWVYVPPDEAQIRAWAISDDWSERGHAASSPSAPEDVLRQLLELPGLFDDYPDADGTSNFTDWKRVMACLNLCSNPGLPVRLIMNSADERRRRAAAEQTRATDDELRELAKDGAWIVRWSVAGNTNAPSDVLDALADDEHPSVRGRARGCIAAPLARRVRPDWPRRPVNETWRRGAIFREGRPPRAVRPAAETTAPSAPVAVVPTALRPPVEPLSWRSKVRGVTYFIAWFGLPGWTCLALSILIPFIEMTAVRNLLKGLLVVAMVPAAGMMWVLASSLPVGRRHGRLAISLTIVTTILTMAGLLLGAWRLMY